MNFCCLKQGTAYGPEYVNNLAAMIGRNLKQDFKLFCLTDDPTGLDPRIDVIELPKDLEKWWGKLCFFKAGLLPAGERVMYFDLDTVIIGSLDEVVKYEGSFATLMDFYWPHLIAPGVMFWKAGDHAKVWDEWELCGRPRHDMGDLWWLNVVDSGTFTQKADRLQILYPGTFISYKVHCQEGRPAPGGPAVVNFHGQPKPHNCGAPWIAEYWCL